MGQKLRVQFPSAGTVDLFHLQRINLIALTFFIDAIICGVGMICSAPFFYGLLVLSLGPIYAIYILAFVALWFINLNWALVGDILLVIKNNFHSSKAFLLILDTPHSQYVIIPTRRATAAAFQILVCHIFGDASSPFIVGLVFIEFRILFAKNLSHFINGF